MSIRFENFCFRPPVARTLPLVLAAFLGIGLFAAHAGETAYAALRAVKQQRPDLIPKLVEIEGARGATQPDSWTFLFQDSEARGGVRELVLQNGAILSERTPLRGYGGVGDLPVIPVDRLNLDSNGAFQLANQEAVRLGVGFHWVNYTLRADANGKAGALWNLELIDHLGIPVGGMTVSAETLKIVDPLRLSSGAGQAVVQPSSSENTTPRGGAIGAVEDFGVRTGRTIRRGTLNVVGSVEEWLTGDRTIGLEED